MLGKLLKHEFRATGRTMLPVLAVMTALVLLANLSVRFGDALISRYQLAAVLFGLIVAAAIIAVIVAEVMTLVVMVLRFYRNLLGNEGYLMHTLPVSVHGLVWSKLIASLVWILVTNLVVFLLGGLSAMNLAHLSIGQLLEGFPSWDEVSRALAKMGVNGGELWLLALEMLLSILVAGLVSCLHFYAAMSLGHMFARDKVVLSVVFFLGFSFLFSTLGGIVGSTGIRYADVFFPHPGPEDVTELLRLMRGVFSAALGWSLIQGAILYVATALGLRKGLNLA